MKLGLCPACLDVQRLQSAERTCRCGQSSFRYSANHEAVLKGSAMLLGLDSHDLHEGLRRMAEGRRHVFSVATVVIPPCAEQNIHRESVPTKVTLGEVTGLGKI